MLKAGSSLAGQQLRGAGALPFVRSSSGSRHPAGAAPAAASSSSTPAPLASAAASPLLLASPARPAPSSASAPSASSRRPCVRAFASGAGHGLAIDLTGEWG